MKRVIFLLIATSFSVLAEQEKKSESPGPSPTLTQARKAIDEGNAQWIEAWDRADATLMASLFADDGVVLGRNGKFFKGPKEIFESMKTAMEAAGKA